MRNVDYIRGVLDWSSIVDPTLRREHQEILLAILNSYGENHWWENENPDVRALWQTHELYLCLPYDDFRTALGGLLGRPVWDIELSRMGRLAKEARTAYSTRYGGLPDALLITWLNPKEEREWAREEEEVRRYDHP